MDKQQLIIAQNIDNHSLFENLSLDEKKQILQYASIKSADKNQLIIEEGTIDYDMYLIIKGNVKVVKQGHRKIRELSRLKNGDSFGEMAIIDEQPRSASVITTVPTEYIVIKLKEIANNDKLKDVFFKLTKAITKIISDRLRFNNEVALHKAFKISKQQVEQLLFGSLFINLIIGICIYIALLSSYMRYESVFPSSYVTIIILVVFLVIGLYFSISNKLTSEELTLEFKGVPKKCIQALKYTLPLLIFGIVMKVLSLSVDKLPVTLGNIFQMYDAYKHVFTQYEYFTMLLMYIVFCVVQEFVVRSLIQNSLMRFLPKRGPWFSNILSNIIFSTLHLHKSFVFFTFAFFPGLFWGWLYAKQKSVYPVILSHIVTGTFLMFIVGWDFID